MTTKQYHNELKSYAKSIEDYFQIEKSKYQKGTKYEHSYLGVEFFDWSSISSPNFYNIDDLDNNIKIIQDFQKEIKKLGLEDECIFIEDENYHDESGSFLVGLTYTCEYKVIKDELNYDEIHRSFVDNIIKKKFKKPLNLDNLNVFIAGKIDWGTLTILTDG